MQLSRRRSGDLRAVRAGRIRLRTFAFATRPRHPLWVRRGGHFEDGENGGCQKARPSPWRCGVRGLRLIKRRQEKEAGIATVRPLFPPRLMLIGSRSPS